MGGYWYVKRLSANDTQATGGHQAGPYIGRNDAFLMFPELRQPAQLNPRVDFLATAVSHDHSTSSNVIWYNNQLFHGTRNETRITRLGGHDSPLLDEDNTGAIVLFFFMGNEGSRECQYWVCRNYQEEHEAESFAGPVEPGRLLFWDANGSLAHDYRKRRLTPSCWLEREQMPTEWLNQFPSPRAILEYALTLRPYEDLVPDARVMRRRDCEYSLFQSVEHTIESDAIRAGFNSLAEFLARAQTILQRRKSRSGRSLELQMNQVLAEEDIPYIYQPTTESGNHPDFIFPSQEAYNNPDYPPDRLRMLAVKTTIKERWRQVIQEADRIQTKHLFTLQEGVSVNQFAQIESSNVRLVVPEELHSSYPSSVVPRLLTLSEFLGEVNAL